MPDFLILKNAISVFSAEVDLDDAVARRLFRKELEANKQSRDELIEAIENENTDWCSLLCDETSEVFPTDSQEEARAWAIANLWEPHRDLL